MTVDFFKISFHSFAIFAFGLMTISVYMYVEFLYVSGELKLYHY